TQIRPSAPQQEKGVMKVSQRSTAAVLSPEEAAEFRRLFAGAMVTGDRGLILRGALLNVVVSVWSAEETEDDLDELSGEAQARVGRLCGQYERDCKQGAKIEAFLVKVNDAEERAALLEQLLRVDMEHRRRSSRPASPAEYLRRFPPLDQEWLFRLFAF